MSLFASLLLLVLLYVLSIFVSLYASQLGELTRAAVLGAGFALSSVLFYFQFYAPLIRVQESDRARLVSELLPAIEGKYRDAWAGDYRLRISVMKARRRYPGSGPGSLKIDYCQGEYTEAEREQVFRLGEGCCGIALRDALQCVYDREDIPAPARSLSATQREVTAHLASILSTPVFRRSDVIGSRPVAIFNLDSPDPLKVTGFDRLPNQLLVRSFAEIIGALL